MNIEDNGHQYDNVLPRVIFVRFQKTITIPGSGTLEISHGDIGWFVPTGYRPIGLVGFEMASENVIVYGVNPLRLPFQDSPMIWLKNRQSSAYEDATIAVTYAYTNMEMDWSQSSSSIFNYSSAHWSDWERDLPEGAGVLLTMENAGPVTNE